MKNMVVLHFVNRRIAKGTTSDFFPNKTVFHVIDKNTGKTIEVKIPELKAVFFVKDFVGRKYYQERKDIDRTGLGRKIKVRFKDGETLIGYTTGFSPNKTGFFLFPSDPRSNNERIFVVNAATDEILFA